MLEYEDQQQRSNKESLSVKDDLIVTGGVKASDYEAVARYQHTAASAHRHGPPSVNLAVQVRWRHSGVGLGRRRRLTGARDYWNIVLGIDG